MTPFALFVEQRLMGAAALHLQEMTSRSRGAEASYSEDVQQNAYGAPEYENYQQPFQTDQMPQKKKIRHGCSNWHYYRACSSSSSRCCIVPLCL